jgi:hypothetical protein
MYGRNHKTCSKTPQLLNQPRESSSSIQPYYPITTDDEAEHTAQRSAARPPVVNLGHSELILARLQICCSI